MLNKKNYLVLTILFLVITAGISLLVLQGQTNKEKKELSSTPIKSKEKSSDMQKNFPIVEYSSEFLSVDEKERSKKYDKGMQILFPELSKNEESFLTLDWSEGLPALPIKESSIVVLGKVSDAKAHLSAGKKSVFSEFKIEIEDVLKNSSEQKIEKKSHIKAEREGGIVQYSSGFKLWHRVAGQQMPKLGSRYMFFLTNEFPIYGLYKQDFYILTAYELKEGKIIPLDNLDDPQSVFSIYEEKDETVLLNDLQNLLKTN